MDDDQQGHPGTQSADKDSEIQAYMRDQFGDRGPLFLYSTDAQQRLLGHWLKIIRECRPSDKRPSKTRRPRHVRRGGKSQDTALHQDQRSKCLSQAGLALRAIDASKALFDEELFFDDRLIRKIEAGEVPLNRRLVLCLAVALRADKHEIAILFDAAGYNGWDWYKTEVRMARSSILTSMERGAQEHQIKKLTSPEILHVIKLWMDAEFSDAQQE